MIQEADSIARKDSDQRLELCRQCNALLEQTDFPEGRIKNNLILAETLHIKSQYQEAHAILEEIEDLCREHENKKHLANWYFEIARTSNKLADYGNALLQAEESLLLCQHLNIRNGEAATHMVLSLLYQNINITDKALEHAMTALEIFRSLEDTIGISTMLNNIGIVYDGMNNFNQAYQCYKESLELKRETEDERGVANTLNNMANILFWSRKEYDKALKLYNESLAISRRHRYPEFAAYSLQQMGQVYCYTEKYQKAIKSALDAVKILETQGLKADLAYALMDLGFVYFNAGEQEKSIEIIQRGLCVAKEANYTLKLQQGYNLLRQIYEEIGDYKNATHYSTLFINLQTERLNEVSDKRAKHLAVLYEVEKARQEKEIYRLQTEKLHQETEYKSRELTTLAMHLMQKNEFLNKISRQIEEVDSTSPNELTDLLCSVRQQVREALNSEQGWEYFEQQFKLVHHDFISKLSELYPSLTPTELRVSAFLRMNLSTKEIANLLYQSPRTVESCRYRLRRKMNLAASDNLSTFLASI